MSLDTILYLLLAFTMFLFFFGLYKSTMEKKVQARENIQSLLGGEEAARKQSQSNLTLFKKREEEALLRKRAKKGGKSKAYELEIKLERANLMLRVEEFVLMCLLSGALGFVLGLLLGGMNPLFGVGGLVGGVFLPYLFLNVKIWMRMRRAASTFADVLDTMVNCFKTGYGFNRAVQVIAENFDDPWGTEFGKMGAEMSLGSNIEDALVSLSNRVPSPDVDMFVTSLLIQKETGGNLAELLANLSTTCRERFKLYRKIGAISAQGKLSASIVCCVPFLLMLLMWVFLPAAVNDFLSNIIGVIILSITMVWMIVGIFVLFRIVQIEV
jgi:tight adherence protein B